METKRNKMLKETGRERQRFSIRKLSVGAASVLLGTMLFWGTNATVQAAADSGNADTQTSETENNKDVKNSETLPAENKADSPATSDQDSKNEQALEIKQGNPISFPSNFRENKQEVEGREVTDDKYEIIKHDASIVENNPQSHENLHLVLKVNGNREINEGDYIDVKWGLKYRDSATNSEKFKKVDDYLKDNIALKSENFSQNCGIIKSTNDGYRIIFNDKVKNLGNDLTFDLNLEWANLSHVAALKSPQLFRGTTDESQNGNVFGAGDINDIQIGNNIFSSGLYKAKYVSTNKKSKANTSNAFGVVDPTTQRKWNKSNGGKLANIDTNWANNIGVSLDLNQTGNDFTITLKVPNNDYWHYKWATEQDVINSIKSHLAYKSKQNVINPVLSGNATNLFVGTSTTNDNKPDPGKITVQRTLLSDWKDPERNNVKSYKATYHVQIENKNVNLLSYFYLLNVSHDGFILPTDVHNGDDDWAAAENRKSIKMNHDNFGSPVDHDLNATTGNKVLQESLNNTLPAQGSIVNVNGKNINAIPGTKWVACVEWDFYSSDVGANVNISDWVNAHIVFKDIDDKSKIVDQSDEQYFQKTTGTPIQFSDNLNTALTKLENGENKYQLVKVVKKNLDGSETEINPASPSDKQNLTTYQYGNLDQTKAFNNGNMEFVVYLKKGKSDDNHNEKPEKQDVQTTIHYINVSNSNKQSGFQPSDGTKLDHDIAEAGKDSETFPNKLWDFANDGWTLVAQDEDVKKGKFRKDMPKDLYVYLKKTAKNPGEDHHQGTTPPPTVEPEKPTAPQPSKPQASKPQSSKPETPKTPKKPNVPSTKKHHNHKKTSKKHWNENYGVHGQKVNGSNKHWSNNFRPHSQNENIGPHAGIPANDQASSNGKNSSNATLPETGEKQNNLGLIGLAFASIAGLFGMASDRKRKN